ncbi:MAG: hypothetical protein ACPL3B_07395, partial [Fervidobacterium sp.]
VKFIEGPWILRPSQEPKRILFYFHFGNIESFPKEIVDAKSAHLIPFVLTFSILGQTVTYPQPSHATRTGIWQISTKRPLILSVRYEIYDQNLDRIGTLDNSNIQILEKLPFNFRSGKQPRFSKYDEEYVDTVTSNEGLSLGTEFLRTLYAKRFFINYIASSFSFVEIGDIDAILLYKSNRFIVEIKEKFPIPATAEFGWDAHRIVPYFLLAREMKAKVLYCIREVVSEVDRTFKDWKIIDLDKFLLYANYAAAIAGSAGAFGTGQRTTTLQVPVKEFYSLSQKSITDVLNAILESKLE